MHHLCSDPLIGRQAVHLNWKNPTWAIPRLCGIQTSQSTALKPRGVGNGRLRRVCPQYQQSTYDEQELKVLSSAAVKHVPKFTDFNVKYRQFHPPNNPLKPLTRTGPH